MQCILVDLQLGFESILKQITHGNIHYVKIPKVGRSTRNVLHLPKPR